MDRFEKPLGYAILAIEFFVSAVLIVLSLAAAWTLVTDVYNLATSGFIMRTPEFNAIIGTVLEIFILVELFRIAMAYMQHRNVIPTVLEAALVAVARKFVVFEGATNYLQYALGLSALLLAVAVSWWLLDRANACELNE